jgi:hypothetical protein
MSGVRIVLSLSLVASMAVAIRLLATDRLPPPDTGAAEAIAAGPPRGLELAGERAVASPGPAFAPGAVDAAPPLSPGQRDDREASDSQAPRAPKAPPPPTEDPEQLAAWFERQVEGELLRQKAGAAVEPGRPVDWAYLADVFAGRISGIPNERLAGVSLQEMDRLGQVPYVEQLRQEKRFDELRDLGFENETIPWPACLRTATCRIDRASSPPG